MIRVNLLRDATNVGIRKDATFATKMGDGTRLSGGGADNRDVVIKLLLLVLPLFGGIGAAQYMEMTKKSELEAIKVSIAKKGGEVKALGGEIEAVKNFKKEKERLLVQIDTIKNLSKERLRNVKALEALQTLVPERAWLTSLKVTGNTVEFDGMAVDDRVVAEFMSALEENIYFSNVRLIKTSEKSGKDGVLKAFMVETALEGL